MLFAGTVAGETWMWKIPSGDCKTFPGHGERNECGKLLADGRKDIRNPILFLFLFPLFNAILGKRIVVGYSDGSAKVFDLKTLDVLQHLSAHNAHTNTISSIDCHRDNNLIVTGSLDSTAKLYHTQTGKVCVKFLMKQFWVVVHCILFF